MALLIKKVIDLSHLGKSYEGITLVFRSIPATDLAIIDKERSIVAPDNKDDADLSKILPFFVSTLQKYFVDGNQGDEAVVAEDLNNLDSDSLIYCFQILTGQDIDPKEESSSTTTSITAENNQQK